MGREGGERQSAGVLIGRGWGASAKEGTDLMMIDTRRVNDKFSNTACAHAHVTCGHYDSATPQSHVELFLLFSRQEAQKMGQSACERHGMEGLVMWVFYVFCGGLVSRVGREMDGMQIIVCRLGVWVCVASGWCDTRDASRLRMLPHWFDICALQLVRTPSSTSRSPA